MTPTKLLLGQMGVVFAIILAGVWGATQWAAAMLGYQAELGSPWFNRRAGQSCSIAQTNRAWVFGWQPNLPLHGRIALPALCRPRASQRYYLMQ